LLSKSFDLGVKYNKGKKLTPQKLFDIRKENTFTIDISTP